MRTFILYEVQEYTEDMIHQVISFDCPVSLAVEILQRKFERSDWSYQVDGRYLKLSPLLYSLDLFAWWIRARATPEMCLALEVALVS